MEGVVGIGGACLWVLAELVADAGDSMTIIVHFHNSFDRVRFVRK